MDDQKFDDIIKGKLQNYEERGFDPSSLASLRHQMAAAPGTSGYQRYRHEIITGLAIAISTLLILGIQNYWNKKHSAELVEAIRASMKTSSPGAELQTDSLSGRKNTHPDTVRIIEYRYDRSEDYQSLLLLVTALEKEIQQLRNQQTLSSDYDHASVFSDSPVSSRIRNPLLKKAESGYAHARRVLPRKPDHKIRTDFRASHKRENTIVRPLSQKMAREMERHYQKGVGLKLAPVIETSKGIYSSGTGQFNIGYGLLSELVLSPSLSIEAGAIYSKRYYEIGSKEELTGFPLPGVNESSGDLQKAEVDNWILELPLNVKYRYPASLTTHWVGGIGYSPQLYMKQIFEYDYAFDDGSGSSGFVTHSIYESKSARLYPGTFNFQIGLNHQLKNHKQIETSIIYQHGIIKMGIEKNKTSFIGLRGTYWFTLR